MKQNILIYPGTFDPITLGHMDIIKRASQLFQKVVVAIAANNRKSPVFPLAQRIVLAELALSELLNIEVVGFEGLLIDFAKRIQANIILRGLRAVSDFEYEFQLAAINRRLAPNMETLFMTPGEQYTFLSASMVKEIAELRGDVSEFVHPAVKQALYKKFGYDYGTNDN